MADFSDLLNFLRENKEKNEFFKPRTITNFHGEIEFINVNFSYDKNAEERSQTLKKLNFKIGKGKSVAIVGGKGAGKTSILRLLYKLFDLDAGQITIDGVDISKLSLQHLRSLITVVP